MFLTAEQHAGLSVVTTSSSRNFALLREFGADLCLDRDDIDNPGVLQAWLEKVAAAPLTYAIDCVSSQQTANATVDCLLRSSAPNPQICFLLVVDKSKFGRVTVHEPLAYSLFGKKFSMWPWGEVEPRKSETDRLETWYGLIGALQNALSFSTGMRVFPLI